MASVDEQLTQLLRLNALVQRTGGLFASTAYVRPWPGEPRFSTRIVELGNLNALRSSGAIIEGSTPQSPMIGAGTHPVDPQAFSLALAEGLERYCSCTYHARQLVWASPNELGADALNLHEIPQCSTAELNDPKCPLQAPQLDKPIRWVRGTCLNDGRMVYLPAIMVFLDIPYASSAERFWFPISTGCALHASYEQAVTNALLEVVERDALSIVWLQKLALPRLQIDSVSGFLAECWTRCEKAAAALDYLFFDATTDLGLSTVLGLQVTVHDPDVSTLVSCATHLDPPEALAKVLRDMGAIRHAFRTKRRVPSEPAECNHLFDGAAYMARFECRRAFDFLTETKAARRLSGIANSSTGDPMVDLALILKRLADARCDSYAVDISTDEAIRLGFRAVRVLVPRLQPLSFHYRARFLGNPRLFEAPVKMGYAAWSESGLNPWPHPFA